MIHTLELHESASDIISELFKELVDLTRQIKNLRADLEAALSPPDILTYHNQLRTAKQLRSQVLELLKVEFDEPVTLETLMLKTLTIN